MLMLSIILLLIALVAALFAFGLFSSPYTGTFKVVFYFSLILFLATIAGGLIWGAGHGYDPTPEHPRGVSP